MRDFIEKLRELSEKHILAELEAKDLHRNGRSKCSFRKLEEIDDTDKWYVCTHPDHTESPWTFACNLDNCPYIAQGMRKAHDIWAAQRSRERNERKRLAQ